MDTNLDLYKLLNIKRNATDSEIHKAFRDKSRNYHPDKIYGQEEFMKKLTNAKSTLLDPDKRAKYDDYYECDDNNTPEELKLYLNCGKRLSDDYREKFDNWIKEFSEIHIIENKNTISDKLNKINKLLSNNQNHSDKHFNVSNINKFEALLESSIENYNFWRELSNILPNDILRFEFKLSDRMIALRLNANNLLELGLIQFRKKKYKLALSCLFESTKTDKQNYEIINQKAKYLTENDIRDDAIYYYWVLLNKAEYLSSALFSILDIICSSDTRKYLQIFLISIAKLPENEDLYDLVIDSLIENDMISEAVGALHKQLLINRNNHNSRIRLKILEEKLNEKNYQILYKFYYEFCSETTKQKIIIKMAEYMTSNVCIVSIIKLYENQTKGIIIENLQNRVRALLYILNAYILSQQKKIEESLKHFQNALILYPTEDIRQAICILIDKNYVLYASMNLINDIKNENLFIPKSHQYVNLLRMSPGLRCVKKFESNIINNKDLTDFDKAMLYLDLNMSSCDSTNIYSNMFIASQYLLEDMTKTESMPRKYASRNLIIELIVIIIFCLRRSAEPVIELHYLKLCFILISKSNRILSQSLETYNHKNGKEVNLVTDIQKEILDTISSTFNALIKVSPFTTIPIVLSADMVYLDLVLTQFSNDFYNYKIKSEPNHDWIHLYKYYLFEYSVRNSTENSQVLRENSMKSLLDTNNWTISSVESLMNWNAIYRDENGFIDTTRFGLQYEFSEVIGLEIDIENGVFQILFKHSNKHTKGLFDKTDVDFVLKNGISSSFFTLDQPDLDLRSHPFQEMKFYPKCLSNSNYLKTLLHADYLLKMFTIGTEVSAKQPFIMRDNQNLINSIPKFLRYAVKSINDRKDGINTGNVHRFWIEPKELSYTESIQNDKLVYTFGECPFIVKKHLMKYNSDGLLVDDIDSEDSEDDVDYEENSEDSGEEYDYFQNISREKEFSIDFSDNYDEIGEQFPVLLRLRELLKLGAVSTLLRSIVNNLEEAKEQSVDTAPIKQALNSMRSQFEYPLNTDSKVNHHYWQCLRDNNIYDENTVIYSQRNDLKSNIRRQLQNAENQLIENLSKSLSDNFHVSNKANLQPHLYTWLNYTNDAPLLAFLAENIRLHRMELYSRLPNYVRSLGYKLDFDINENQINNNQCVWVPSAFNNKNNTRVYGGVNLRLKLNDRSPGSSISGSGSGNGSKSKSKRSTGSAKAKRSFGKQNDNPRKENNVSKEMNRDSCDPRPKNDGSMRKMFHKTWKPRKKQAYEAAKNVGKGSEPHYHRATDTEPAHYHPADQYGNKIQDGSHYYWHRN